MASNRIIFSNALLIFAGIAGYFLVMKIFGLEDVAELRFLNLHLFCMVLTGLLKQTLLEIMNLYTSVIFCWE